MRSQEIASKKNKRFLDALRSHSSWDEQSEQEEEAEEGENEDIADASEWRVKYNQVRHEVYVCSEGITVGKQLSLNKTTKLKHKIVTMMEQEEEKAFDRQKERETIFKKIKMLRIETRSLKDKVKMKKLQGQEKDEQENQLQYQFNQMKIEQMEVFTRIDNIRNKIEEALKEISDNIEEGIYNTLSDTNDDEDNKKDINEDAIQIQNQAEEEEDPDEEEVKEILIAAGVITHKEISEDNEEITEQEFDQENASLQEQGEEQQQDRTDSSSRLNHSNAIPRKENRASTLDNEKENDEDEIQREEKELEDIKQKAASISEKIRSLGDNNLGWLPEDHNEFLKVRTRLGIQGDTVNNKLIEECVKVIGLYNAEEVEEHANLYGEFIRLSEKRRDMLKVYKDKKEQVFAEKEEKKRQKENDELKKIESKIQNRKDELAKKKEQVLQWKMQRDGRKNEIVNKELEERKILIVGDKNRKVQDEKEREERRQLIREYKRQKEEEENKIREMEEKNKLEKKKLRRISLQDVNRIREKEEIMMKKKQILIDLHKEKVIEKEDNIVKIIQINKDKFSYVEPRLQEQTKAAERRTTQKYDPLTRPDRFAVKADSFAGNVLGNGGRLKVPSWRQPLQ